jgi:membrane-associated phospholipid phosphatase
LADGGTGGLRARVAWLWALATVCAGGLVVTYLVFVRTYGGQRLDQGAFDGRALANGRAREAADQLLTTISVATLALAILVLVVQAFARRRLALSVVAGVVIVGAVLTTEVLKHHLLERPDLLRRSIYHNSFPSGHATVAFAVGIAATLVVPPALRRWVAGLAVLYGAAIGVAVVAVGWHRPSDVVGAFLIVIAWAAAAVAIAATIDDDAFLPTANRWLEGEVSWHYLAIGIGLPLVGFVTAVAIAFASQGGRIGWTLVDAAFLAACAALAGLAAILMAALLTALRTVRTVPPG